MKYQLVEKELVQFTIADLENYLGVCKAHEFIRQYRNQISLMINNDLRLRCANLSELCARWKEDNFLQ